VFYSVLFLCETFKAATVAGLSVEQSIYYIEMMLTWLPFSHPHHP